MKNLTEAASAIADAIKTGVQLPRPQADDLVAAAEGLPSSEIVEIIEILQPFIRGCDWPRYLAQEGIPLHGLAPDERSALHPAPSLLEDIEDIPKVRDLRKRESLF